MEEGIGGPSGFKPWHHNEWRDRDHLLQEFTPSSLEEEQVVEGRYLLVKAKFDTCILVFMNIYVPNNGAKRKSFLEKVNSRLNSCGKQNGNSHYRNMW